MTLPNFLIIGAAKAGTSSVFRYLVQHPQIFGCPIKEPSFFAFEGERVCFKGPGDEPFNRAVVTNYEEYEALFDGVTNEIAIGEASVVYLHNGKAPARIKHYLPDVRLIAILRNPADRAISSYSHLIRDGFEPLSNFVEALDAETWRKKANWQHLWQYTALGFYFDALNRYFSLFPRKNIAVHTYDELKEDPAKLLRGIFTFLDVDASFHPDTSYKHNVSGVPKSKLLHRFITKPTYLKSVIKPIVPKRLRASVQMKIMEKNIDTRKIQVPRESREYLRELFRQDILNTQDLIDKDLSAWLE